VKAAVRYPAFVMSALAIGLTVLMIFVIPTFAATYKSLKAELPYLTQVLIGLSTFMRSKWWLLLLAEGPPTSRSTDGRPRRAATICGTAARRRCRSLAALSARRRWRASAATSRWPAVPACRWCRRWNWRRASPATSSTASASAHAPRCGAGESFTRVATTTSVFSPVELQMIGVGEAAGELDQMMDELAQIHSDDVAYEASKLGETMEPILLGVLGVLVGILLLGVFTPLWNLGQTMLHPTH
jgi:MSHA biogenesis protein MshG